MTSDRAGSPVPGPKELVDRPVAATTTDAAEVPWRRLDRRMIAVDAVQALVSLVPVGISVVFFGATLGGGLWPVLAVALSGVGTATVDAYRWTVTAYRITDELVERRSGFIVRNYRSLRRDRVRTVDVRAKLRHRLGGLRVVMIGAGQQSATNDAALDLDAVSVADARALHDVLLRRAPARGPSGEGPAPDRADVEPPDGTGPGEDRSGDEVIARFRPAWIVYNACNVWAYVMAAGLLWGAYWTLPVIGVDSRDLLGSVVDWDRLGVAWSIAVIAAVATVVGIIGLAVNFVFEYWDFELTRVPADGGTVLRTRHGLFTTREVARDEERTRGIQVSQPLWWRWIGAADTTVITTGLSMTALSQPAAILPRAPHRTARRVAAAVVGTRPGPIDAPLEPHPRAALRRRVWWATITGGVVAAGSGWLVVTDVLPPAAMAATVVVWVLARSAAHLAYRALGHAIAGDHLVVRSGLNSRTTTALQRSAVSTVAVRESVLQRRLGLRTVTVMTSAGHGAYQAFDLDRDDAVAFADAAAPGLLTAFLATGPDDG